MLYCVCWIGWFFLSFQLNISLCDVRHSCSVTWKEINNQPAFHYISEVWIHLGKIFIPLVPLAQQLMQLVMITQLRWKHSSIHLLPPSWWQGHDYGHFPALLWIWTRQQHFMSGRVCLSVSQKRKLSLKKGGFQDFYQIYILAIYKQCCT